MQKYNLNSNDVLNITNNGEYLINTSLNQVINILESVEAKVLLDDLNGNVVINLNKYSTLELISISNKLSNSNITINMLANSNLNYKMGSVVETNANLVCNLNEEKANASIEYLVLNKNTSSKFNQVINHNALETSSEINNIGVTFENSNIKFDTTSHIYKGMSKSSAKQLSRGVILADNSSITSLPILKIDEYDVFANHGTAIGRMSDDELFYLMSRGLTKEDSYKLILSSLINPFIKSIWDEESKNVFQKEVNELI